MSEEIKLPRSARNSVYIEVPPLLDKSSLLIPLQSDVFGVRHERSRATVSQLRKEKDKTRLEKDSNREKRQQEIVYKGASKADEEKDSG